MKINQVWTKRKFILLVCACGVLLSFSSPAQTLRFHVVDAQTHHALDNVNIFKQNSTDTAQTDISGEASLVILEGDTISMQLDGYFDIHLLIKSINNYDFKHPVAIFMTSFSDQHHVDDMRNMENYATFKFHFTHDQLPGAHLQVHVMEHTQAEHTRISWVQHSRNQQGRDFNIINLKLEPTKLPIKFKD